MDEEEIALMIIVLIVILAVIGIILKEILDYRKERKRDLWDSNGGWESTNHIHKVFDQDEEE